MAKFVRLLTCAVVVLGSTAGSAGARVSAGTDGVSPEVGAYIVVLKDSVAHPGLIASEHAARLGVTVTHVYEHALRGYAANVPAARIDALREDPRVAFLAPVHPLEMYAQTKPTGIDRVEADVSSAAS